MVPTARQMRAVHLTRSGPGAQVMKPSKAKAGADAGSGFEWNEDTMLGVALVVGALVCDGIYGPYQVRCGSTAPSGLHRQARRIAGGGGAGGGLGRSAHSTHCADWRRAHPVQLGQIPARK